jgi:hypothetical protein
MVAGGGRLLAGGCKLLLLAVGAFAPADGLPSGQASAKRLIPLLSPRLWV